MQEGKTIGQLMEEMRQKAGAQNYHGHDYMDLQRFAENTRHMIIFDVLTNDSPVGWKGPVDYTVVNGKVTVRSGKLVNLDEEKAAREAAALVRDYLSR